MPGTSQAPNTTCDKLSDKLYLVHVELPKESPHSEMLVSSPPPKGVNHILIVDCSGSMWADLPKLREHVKGKLPKLLGKDDTLSMIWFSGRGQCGILLEGERVASLLDLQTVNSVVDRWLQPVGMTGFVEPLKLAASLYSRLPQQPCSLFFMSDGQDNQWSRVQILEAMQQASGNMEAVTVVEYGYYADRNMLASMAATAAVGGSHIFAEDFPAFVAHVEKAVQKRTVPARLKTAEIEDGNAKCFAMIDGDIVCFEADSAGHVQVPERVTELHYLGPRPVGKERPKKADGTAKTDTAAHYAAIAIAAAKMDSATVLPLLRDLADVSLVEEYGNCFGKQAYSAFIARATEAAFDPKKRFVKGRDPNCVPREDAFTLMDLFDLLQADGARLLLDSPDFRYAPIARQREDADPDALTFVRTKKPEGYEIDALVYNQERANMSFRVIREGTLDLVGRLNELPPREHGKPTPPNPFPSFQYRNYTVVKDGIVNIRFLPVELSTDALATLKAAYDDGRLKFGALGWDSIPTRGSKCTVVFDLLAIPFLNRASVKSIAADAFFRDHYEMARLKAEQKVYNYYAAKYAPPKKNEGFAFVYGKEAAEWLASLGISDSQGYRPPHTRQAAGSGDFYTAKELSVTLKGLSALCKVEEAAKGKGGASGALMRPAVERIEAFLASDVVKSASNPQPVVDAWLQSEMKVARQKARIMMRKSADYAMAIIVGQTWIFPSLDETSMSIKGADGKDVLCSAEMKEVQVEL